MRVVWLEEGLSLDLGEELKKRMLEKLETIDLSSLSLREYEETGDHLMLVESHPSYIKLVWHANKYMVVAGTWRRYDAIEYYIAQVLE
ncbi:MAG TPA: hypothetical protein ENG30_04200 [Thermofilaceae archaeon]|nr:hypothetical protein [Thermofilaceae archaeon]